MVPTKWSTGQTVSSECFQNNYVQWNPNFLKPHFSEPFNAIKVVFLSSIKHCNFMPNFYQELSDFSNLFSFLLEVQTTRIPLYSIFVTNTFFPYCCYSAIFRANFIEIFLNIVQCSQTLKEKHQRIYF